jgi:hypothetical protein
MAMLGLELLGFAARHPTTPGVFVGAVEQLLGMGIQAGRLIRGQFDPEQTWGIATMCLGELSSMKK